MKHFIKISIYSYLLCVLSGCLSFDRTKDNSEFFILNPLIKKEKNKQANLEFSNLNNNDQKNDTSSKFRKQSTEFISIGIRKIELPEYLNYPYLIWQNEDEKIDFDYNLRWAEDLQSSVKRVLVQNMTNFIEKNTEKFGCKKITIHTIPWDLLLNPTYEISIKIIEWMPKIDQELKMIVQWQITYNNYDLENNFANDKNSDNFEKQKHVSLKQTQIIIPFANHNNCHEIVNSMNESLKNLAIEITNSLKIQSCKKN